MQIWHLKPNRLTEICRETPSVLLSIQIPNQKGERIVSSGFRIPSPPTPTCSPLPTYGGSGRRACPRAAVVAAPKYCHDNFSKYFTPAIWSDLELGARVFVGRRHRPCYFNTGVLVICLRRGELPPSHDSHLALDGDPEGEAHFPRWMKCSRGMCSPTLPLSTIFCMLFQSCT
jgi:hypothetical protein